MKKLLKPIVIILILILCSSTLNANTLVVKKVHSGNLIEFEGGFTAHLTGIIVPDLSSELGKKIFEFTMEKLKGKLVKVFTYTRNNMASGIVRDEDGHAFVQIVYGTEANSNDWDINFNELLLKKGYAKVNEEVLPDDLVYFKEIAEEAQKSRIGIWEDRE